MSIIVKKAGEAVAKGVLKKGTASAPRIPLEPPRAVTVEEAKADTFLTHKKSIDSTMTPWKGWFQRWVADTFGETRYQQIRSTLLFMPDDIYDDLHGKLAKYAPMGDIILMGDLNSRTQTLLDYIPGKVGTHNNTFT